MREFVDPTGRAHGVEEGEGTDGGRSRLPTDIDQFTWSQEAFASPVAHADRCGHTLDQTVVDQTVSVGKQRASPGQSQGELRLAAVAPADKEQSSAPERHSRCLDMQDADGQMVSSECVLEKEAPE